jgi:hypothetical protein
MTVQYLRKCSLIVADANGQGIELGALRVVFEVRRGDYQTPNTADIRIYNLSDNTSNQLRGVGGVPEFQYLRLSVSYGSDPLAQIFAGSIKQVRQGREDQKNSYIAITAAAGDGVYNFAPAAFTLAAGRTAVGTVKNLIAVGAAAAEVMNNTKPIFSTDQQLVEGYIPVPALDPNQAIRGRTYFGAWRDEMRDFAKSQDCKWFIDDEGQLSVVPLTSYIPGGTVLITPQTGLIGVPEQTQNGLAVRVLLNPNIKIGHTIKLDSTINELRLGLDTTSVGGNLTLKQGGAKLNAAGLYYVMKADHTGDTRGTQWYTDLTCLSVDATATPASAAAQASVGLDVIPRY